MTSRADTPEESRGVCRTFAMASVARLGSRAYRVGKSFSLFQVELPSIHLASFFPQRSRGCHRGETQKMNWKRSPRFFNSPIPFSFESGTVPSVPATKFHATFTASFYSTLDTAAAALLTALSACHIAEIDVRLRVRGSGEEKS